MNQHLRHVSKKFPIQLPSMCAWVVAALESWRSDSFPNQMQQQKKRDSRSFFCLTLFALIVSDFPSTHGPTHPCRLLLLGNTGQEARSPSK